MKKGKILVVIGVILVIGLMVWGRLMQKDELVMFQDTGIACLINGHTDVAEHIHPELTITVDGVEEVIPADIGITPDCMPELHTHDETGKIHAESFLPGRLGTFNLSHFFMVWGKDYNREGFDLEVVQDGEVKPSVQSVKFKDLSQIELRYTTQVAEEVTEAE